VICIWCMKDITITCDRCGKVVTGNMEHCDEYGGTITSGFYIVSEGNWKEFGRWEEENICDDCMHSDPKYIEMYK